MVDLVIFDTPPPTLQKQLSQLPAVDMQKVPGGFCFYSNRYPKVIQPSFDAKLLFWMEALLNYSTCQLQEVKQGIVGESMFGNSHDSKDVKIQVTYTEKYSERVPGILFEVLGIWRNVVSVLALLLDNIKCVKFTKSGIRMFKSDLKTGIICFFSFKPGMVVVRLTDPEGGIKKKNINTRGPGKCHHRGVPIVFVVINWKFSGSDHCKKKNSQLPEFDMQKVPGSFCCYSNHAPQVIQPRFDAQSLCQKFYTGKHVEFEWKLGWSMLHVNCIQLIKFFLQWIGDTSWNITMSIPQNDYRNIKISNHNIIIIRDSDFSHFYSILKELSQLKEHMNIYKNVINCYLQSTCISIQTLILGCIALFINLGEKLDLAVLGTINNNKGEKILMADCYD
ncbi:hypothetical protein VP01_2995g1 [Puccinia sorghi]|uniref:Uncharacterized protein n=1 Tax=Puccinia sorghi TaxID=27349 RepID=A0A0L6V0E3_9BASI|nr:hypothetical protein VP01_2995g1 [Puccinia sorghi]